jgi:hypothetical protein
MPRQSIFIVTGLLAAAALALAACSQAQPNNAGESPCARHGLAFGTRCATAPPSALPIPSRTAPVFAYYYMWMQGSYWSTNKLDHPAQPFPGNYNSANPAVISWQIGQAKAAGITGFIVSWKNNATYQLILPLVEAAANKVGFKLAMEYETRQDFPTRTTTPAVTAAADFKYFAENYASNPAWYRVNGKPLTMIDDSNRYTTAALASITRPVRSSLTVLQDVSTVAVYQKYAPYTDGDAYYWSSQNPSTNPGAAARLNALSAAVHAAHGTWIAPFAPGYNSTLIGGHVIVPRASGATLAVEYATAARSTPDILGLVSWNEWTENTYVEPSVTFGYTYVNTLKGLLLPAG